MDQKQDKAPFPGTRKGIVRVFIKRTQQEDSAQLHFHFYHEEPEQD